MYSQNLIDARSDRDVVNLFYGFLSGPDNLPATFDGKAVTSKLQKADHLIFGFEWDLAKNLYANVEGYYKYFGQLTNLNRNKIYDKNTAPAGTPDRLIEDFIIEKGDAEGIDLSVKYDIGNVYFWAVYSFAYVNRYYENIDGVLTHYYPHFDRRHNINFVATYRFGETRTWEISARWNFGSGFPFTQTQGDYEKLDFSGGIYSDYTTANGTLGIVYGDLNGGRLPTYHRLDLNFQKKFMLSENSRISVDLSFINVYDRKNVFYRDRISGEIVYQLPFMPSLGITWNF
jgi:hypothetical protein